MVVAVGGKAMPVKPVQPRKALRPTVISAGGSVSAVMLVQPRNASSVICFTGQPPSVSGTTTVALKPVYFWITATWFGAVPDK